MCQSAWMTQKSVTHKKIEWNDSLSLTTNVGHKYATLPSYKLIYCFFCRTPTVP